MTRLHTENTFTHEVLILYSTVHNSSYAKLTTARRLCSSINMLYTLMISFSYQSSYSI